MSADPLIAVAAFDTAFIPYFKDAWDCGLINAVTFPARGRSTIGLQRYLIDDAVDARLLEGKCDNQAFKKYHGYSPTITPLGNEDDAGTANCNLNDTAHDGSCNADINVDFSTLLTTEYKSAHGKDWKMMLTEEGGIIGGVTFVTWFFSIFNI